MSTTQPRNKEIVCQFFSDCSCPNPALTGEKFTCAYCQLKQALDQKDSTHAKDIAEYKLVADKLDDIQQEQRNELEQTHSRCEKMRMALQKIIDTDILGDKPCRKIAWKALSEEKER